MEAPIETEEDLERFIGQYESIRLEFKASALFSQPQDRIVDQLTKEVSAFANTEGGVIVIGIADGKRADKRMAMEIDEGCDPSAMSPERLEKLIASNISPAVPGLVVRPIALSGRKAERVAYVIIVPKGSTAYQARQSLRYYGRTESEAKGLEDHVIRLLMTRGRVAHATIEVADMSLLTADDEYQKRQSELHEKPADDDFKFIPKARRQYLKASKRAFDEYQFSLAIRNDGGVTIRDCMLSVRVNAPFEVAPADQLSDAGLFQFWFSAKTAVRRTHPGVAGSEARLFPEQTMPFPGAIFTARPPAGSSNVNCILEWRLYLDDAPMNSGIVDLAKEVAGLLPQPVGSRQS